MISHESCDYMFKKILSWSLVLLWLFVIFWFSAKNGTVSTMQSRGFTSTIVSGVSKLAYRIGMIDEIPSASEIAKIVYKINPMIRKLAHTTVYFILAILLMFALNTNQTSYKKHALIAVSLCLLYSFTDEFHQTFVSGRTGLFTDCLIDTLGATMGTAVFSIYVKLCKK